MEERAGTQCWIEGQKPSPLGGGSGEPILTRLFTPSPAASAWRHSDFVSVESEQWGSVRTRIACLDSAFWGRPLLHRDCSYLQYDALTTASVGTTV